MHRADPATLARQIARFRRVQAERDPRQVARALVRLVDVARGQENVMPAMLEAVKAYATIGETVPR
jgi:methylmalonyl-CoA mutase N-terminal domain/subunit